MMQDVEKYLVSINLLHLEFSSTTSLRSLYIWIDIHIYLQFFFSCCFQDLLCVTLLAVYIS